MKRIVVGLMAVCLLGSLTVLAEEKTTSEKTVSKEVTLQEIAATGRLAKLTADYTVTEANGTVVKIMAPKVVKGEQASVVDLEKFEKLVGRKVKVVGMGTATTSKTGKKNSVIKTVTSIEETIDSVAAPAAAAPVAAPEAK
jgi:hypothetical protein